MARLHEGSQSMDNLYLALQPIKFDVIHELGAQMVVANNLFVREMGLDGVLQGVEVQGCAALLCFQREGCDRG